MAKEPSSLERAFETVWPQMGGPAYRPQYVFHPTRKWTLDIAFPAVLVGIELDGGVWSQGRHVRPQGYENDCEKFNAAVPLGWRLFRVTTKMLDDPWLHLQPIIDFIRTEENGRDTTGCDV